MTPMYVVYREFGCDLEILGATGERTTAQQFAYHSAIDALNRYDDEGDDETAGINIQKDGLLGTSTYTISVGDVVVERFVVEETKYIPIVEV